MVSLRCWRIKMKWCWWHSGIAHESLIHNWTSIKHVLLVLQRTNTSHQTLKGKSSKKCFGRRYVSLRHFLMKKPWQQAIWLIQIQQQPWGRWLTTTTTTTTLKTRPTSKQQPLADPIHNDNQRTRLLLKALGNHEAFCPQRDAIRPESKRPPILDEPATPYQPIDASKSWWSRRFSVGKKFHLWCCFDEFWFQMAPQMMVKPPNLFQFDSNKNNYYISTDIGVVDSLCQASYHIQKVGHQQWVRPWKHAATEVGWMILMKGDDGRCVMCPTEIWMCIKLLVGMEASQNHRWNYTQKILSENAACSNKKNLYWDLGYGLVNFGFTPWGRYRFLWWRMLLLATNDPQIWMKRKLMFADCFLQRIQGPKDLGILTLDSPKNYFK